MELTRTEILGWLVEDDPRRLESLWSAADEVRGRCVGGDVHLRGLIEFSNFCRRECGYCGLRAGNAELGRYRMTADEIAACARLAAEAGCGTVVLQSGEDERLDPAWLAGLVRRIKDETSPAVTLSVGERDERDYALWRAAGADRYLLRFETSNRELFARIHPSLNGKPSDRVAILRTLRGLGYQIGSGVMIGIPGQTFDDLANDIALFAELDLDMIGVGPFLPHPGTPLGKTDAATRRRGDPEQVPNSELMTYKVVGLARLVCPEANIPSTTALATVNLASGRELGLQRGANVVMPNLTPPQYRELYEIYPAKACIRESAEQCLGCMKRRIESIGRTVGAGRGDRRRCDLQRT